MPSMLWRRLCRFAGTVTCCTASAPNRESFHYVRRHECTAIAAGNAHLGILAISIALLSGNWTKFMRLHQDLRKFICNLTHTIVLRWLLLTVDCTYAFRVTAIIHDLRSLTHAASTGTTCWRSNQLCREQSYCLTSADSVVITSIELL